MKCVGLCMSRQLRNKYDELQETRFQPSIKWLAKSSIGSSDAMIWP